MFAGPASGQPVDEMGTWVPVGNTVALINPEGLYTRRGDDVTAFFRVQLPATGSGASATIFGLPFVCGASALRGGAFAIGYTNYGAGFVGRVVFSQPYFQFINYAGVVLLESDFSGKTVEGVLQYRRAP